MTYADAYDILEEDHEMSAQEGEILAELGSSAFCEGADAADAMTIARMHYFTPERQEAIDEWNATVAAARETVKWFEAQAESYAVAA